MGTIAWSHGPSTEAYWKLWKNRREKELLLDILMSYLKFFVSMLIYRHISRQEFALRWLFLCPFFFAIVFTLVPPVGFFGYYLVFIAYSFYRNRNIRHLLNIFYGLYPVVMESLIGRLLAFYVFPIIAKKIFSVRNLYFYGVTADYFFVFVSWHIRFVFSRAIKRMRPLTYEIGATFCMFEYFQATV